MKQDLLRSIPQVDELKKRIFELAKEKGMEEEFDLSLLTLICHEKLDTLRKKILNDETNISLYAVNGSAGKEGFSHQISEEVIREYQKRHTYNLKRVVNATGLTLHTNLGRAVLSERAARNVYQVATSYTNLEYDIACGERGTRYAHTEELICRLTGSEGAIVVNNNASAVMLILHALGHGKNMVISRSELVEIGGAFRIPAVMEISGVTLKEVGCTNKTYITDYEEACDAQTAAVLKVHRSNFYIGGFTHDVEMQELKKLSEDRDIPLIYDMGSGSLEELHTIADITCVSGDKLLGGPQCGIIYGAQKYIDILKKDNLIRALRVDKLTLAALEATLWQYEEGRADEIPTYRYLNRTQEDMDELYQLLGNGILDKDTFTYERRIMESYVGGGSKPEEKIQDVCMAFNSNQISAERLAEHMRTSGPVPVVGRISEGKYIIDFRCLEKHDIDVIVELLKDVRI